MFYIGLYSENKKNLLVLDQKACTIDIWYLASPSGPLPSFFHIKGLGPEMTRPGVACFI